MIKFLRAIHLFWWRLAGCAIRQFVVSTKVRRRYGRKLRALRRAVQDRPVRVLFFVSDVSKWKGQSVYDLMDWSPSYSPVVVVFPQDEEIAAGEQVIRTTQETKLAFFRERRMSVRSQWDVEQNRMIPIGANEADIVFYQQPWFMPDNMQPDAVSRIALTFYFPYFVLNNRNNLDSGLEIGQWFHRMLFGHIVFSEEVKSLYEMLIGGGRLRRAGKFLPFGHPMMDNFLLRSSKIAKRGYVIYAPHFSISYGSYEPILKYATFVWSGREILKYAKEHPKIKWVFKPHPGLKLALLKSGLMTVNEVEEYYGEWERIGTTCYTAAYVDLFLGSRAMITDCGSFLTEYAATGNPIIHLENPNSNVRAHPVLEQLYATYYKASNAVEMLKAFDSVLIQEKDPKKEIRQERVRAAGLCDNYAAKNIMTYLDRILMVKAS